MFRGIPFAESPIENRRWTVTNVLDLGGNGDVHATKFGNICPYQLLPRLKDELGEEETTRRLPAISEDCLYLNIWRPKNVKITSKLPVLFVIHGGGFVRNSTCEKKIDGAALAARGVIVVSAEYRLGASGFFRHESFKKNTFWGNTNFGLIDQVQALRWLKRNISKLGGDTQNVTILGSSTGGASVYYHLSSKISKHFYNKGYPLFHRAVSFGGGGFGNLLPSAGNYSAESISEKFFRDIQDKGKGVCSSHAPLDIRGQKYSELLNSTNVTLLRILRKCPTTKEIVIYFGIALGSDNKTIIKPENRRYPYVDNTTVIGPGAIPILINDPMAFLPIPLINGGARKESEVLEYLQNNSLEIIRWLKNDEMSSLDDTDLVFKLASMYGVKNKSYLRRGNNLDYFKKHFAGLFYGDGIFNQAASFIAKHNRSNSSTYTYLYAYQPERHTRWRKYQFINNVNDIDDLYKLSYSMNDAGHTNEFFSFFGNFEARLGQSSYIHPIDIEFSKKSQDYLINFMTTGSPQMGPYKGLVDWPINQDGVTVQHLGILWNPDDARDLSSTTKFHIGTIFNHKKNIYNYFEKLYQMKSGIFNEKVDE